MNTNTSKTVYNLYYRYICYGYSETACHVNVLRTLNMRRRLPDLSSLYSAAHKAFSARHIQFEGTHNATLKLVQYQMGCAIKIFGSYAAVQEQAQELACLSGRDYAWALRTLRYNAMKAWQLKTGQAWNESQ